MGSQLARTLSAEGWRVVVLDKLTYAGCREHLAGFKRPEQVIFVGTLPRNALGKVLKRELRDRYGASS